MKCCVMIHNHRKHVINFIVVEQSFILDYVLSKIVMQQVQEEIFLRVLRFVRSQKMSSIFDGGAMSQNCTSQPGRLFRTTN